MISLIGWSRIKGPSESSDERERVMR